MRITFIILFFSSAIEQPYSSLQLIQIFFDTATFDEINRDRKVKEEAQLSLIGGTMGLLTGFSILSGVEILFFVAKFIISCGRSKPFAAVKGIISNKVEAAGDKVDDAGEEQ